MIVRAALSALAIVLLVAGSAAAPATTMAAQARQFDPPAGPMKLTRVLERRLGDGKSVVVTRSWRVRFHRQGAGYLVDGEPLEVAVEVPPALEPLAEVERRNPQAGPFPIALDRQGRIVEGGPGAAGPVPGLTEAARAYVARRSPDRQAEAMDYVADVQRAGARMASRWPGDLFFPGPARERTAAVPVPGAEAGDVSVRFEGTLEPAGGHLASARRRIVTRVGGSERISLETWRLEVLD
ncbi:hypothetical protein [Pelagerythrobacter marinus]|uniref:hypothetical protein n=1 Tax=Pelagerythrobacter marinus TaxID=538382 RepID=UPI0020368D06|nr:hypothetical protein [Pelagerythrobacter marinus]USA39296.1 hypothetical protein NCF86_13555 [Pelagerythrobacter marinus]WPZ06563.1 hypothetical protein T8T98_14295 [Pelagerythrobacter marinus]